MSINTATTRSYLDFEGLGRLRGNAATGDASQKAAAEKETAQHFEAMFIQMMLKSMREATEKEGLFSSDAEQTFQDMMDRELSSTMAQRSAFGIGDMILNSLKARESVPLSSQDALKLNGRTPTEGLPLPSAPQGLKLQEAIKGYTMPGDEP
jgi:flagellar protein FlgJ